MCVARPAQIRAYNTLSRLARGDILILIQDDQQLPSGEQCRWIGDVVKLFDRWPETGALGLKTYNLCFSSKVTKTNLGAWFVDNFTGINVHWVSGSSGRVELITGWSR